jgi:hypothetical protein
VANSDCSNAKIEFFRTHSSESRQRRRNIFQELHERLDARGCRTTDPRRRIQTDSEFRGTAFLSVGITSLFCFLSLGFIFFQRHRLGYHMFRGAGKRPGNAGRTSIWQAMLNMTTGLSKRFADWLPLACILISVSAVFRYHSIFNDAILIAQARATAEAQKGILAGAFLTDIAAWESRDRKVALSYLVLFEDKNTFVALNLFENDKSSWDRLKGMSPDALNAALSEASQKPLAIMFSAITVMSRTRRLDILVSFKPGPTLRRQSSSWVVTHRSLAQMRYLKRHWCPQQ